MNEYIIRQNSNFIKQWVNLNPNFKNVHYSNNTISFSNGNSIRLNKFLISTLLENTYIKNHIYSMDEHLFYKILYVNVEIMNNINIKEDNTEYVKNIQRSNYGTAIIITDKRKIEIKNLIQVLNAYRELVHAGNNYYVKLTDLLDKLNKNDYDKKSSCESFFDLISKPGEINLTEYNYIRTFSKYMYDLMIYQDYLVGEAKDTFELYNYTINQLLNNEKLNKAQETAINLYKDYLNAYNLKIEKETIRVRKVSSGYSSLVLIIASVIVTLAFIIFLIIIN